MVDYIDKEQISKRIKYAVCTEKDIDEFGRGHLNIISDVKRKCTSCYGNFPPESLHQKSELFYKKSDELSDKITREAVPDIENIAKSMNWGNLPICGQTIINANMKGVISSSKSEEYIKKMEHLRRTKYEQESRNLGKLSKEIHQGYVEFLKSFL